MNDLKNKDIIQCYSKVGFTLTNNKYYLVDLQKWLREEKNMLICIYSNASGYLWQRMDAIGGTYRDDSDFSGPNDSGQWNTYEEALEAGIWEIYYLISN